MSDFSFKAVVFDMDGVIFDSERAVMECWMILADKYGLPNMERPYRACIGVNDASTRRIMLDEYGEDFPYEKYSREASTMYHEKYDGGRLPMKKGVFELLEFLHGHGIRVALASSTKRTTVVNQLRDAGILKFFEVIVTGDMVERSKPFPDIFLKACEELGEKPSDCYAIEDSYNGIRSAHAGGLHPIMVPDLLPADEEMRNLAEAVISDLCEVEKYFEGK